MQGIYKYIPETHHVPTVYTAATVLYSQSVLHVMLFRVLHMCASTLALSAVCVALPITAVLCSSATLCFPRTLLRYCLSDSETVPVAPIITGLFRKQLRAD